MLHGAFLEPRKGSFDNRWREFSVFGLQSNESCAMGEEFHGAAFVDGDVAACVAKDCAVRRHECREPKRVRGRAADDGINMDIALEDF
jgi:hypothetical protein